MYDDFIQCTISFGNYFAIRQTLINPNLEYPFSFFWIQTILYKVKNYSLGYVSNPDPNPINDKCSSWQTSRSSSRGGGGDTHYVRVMGRLRGIDPPFSRHWKKISILDTPPPPPPFF